MRKIAIYLINLYQKTISPDHGVFKNSYPYGFCRFYPSCSEYTKQSIAMHGFIGIFFGFKRILRCNPFNNGGIDLPIENNK